MGRSLIPAYRLKIILRLIFKNCTSYKGAGALVLINKDKIIIENIIFDNNSARIIQYSSETSEFRGVGACGIILCFRPILNSNLNGCFSLFKDIIFQNNLRSNYSLFYVTTKIINFSIYLYKESFRHTGKKEFNKD